MADDKSSTTATSYVPHILFIVAQVYSGLLVIFLLGPVVYAILSSYKLGKITINFKDIFFSFFDWWVKLSALSTIGITLILFCCFLIGFIFTEIFYRFSNLSILPLNDWVAKRNFADNKLVNQILEKSVLKSDKLSSDYVYFNNFIKTKYQLKNRLNKNDINDDQQKQILKIWEKSKKRRPYIKDINLENPQGGKTNDIRHFKIRCGIQKNVHLQRVWDWENFQFSFCLYIEEALLVFNFVFGLSIVYTIVVTCLRGNTFEIFYMVICFLILLLSISLTWLMSIARIDKLKKFHSAHKLIEKILKNEGEL